LVAARPRRGAPRHDLAKPPAQSPGLLAPRRPHPLRRLAPVPPHARLLLPPRPHVRTRRRIPAQGRIPPPRLARPLPRPPALGSRRLDAPPAPAAARPDPGPNRGPGPGRRQAEGPLLLPGRSV